MSATVITHAKFVVYQDKTSLAQPGVVPRDNRAANANPRPIAVATAGDKENLHPITGLPSRMLTSLSKKRKTAVLTTKLLVVSEAPCSPKKRRVSTLPKNPSNLSGKSGLSQRPRRANKAATSRSARRVPKLPRVQEEDVEETERASERVIGELSAKAVDARCYELTVVPLADISEAYEVISDQESVKDGEAPRRAVESAPSLTLPATPKSKQSNTASTAGTDKILLATPDRRRIYSAFTFTSPSASAKRHAASRTSSKHPFSDVLFDPAGFTLL